MLRLIHWNAAERSQPVGFLTPVGVDELMDMARTTVNLVGNCLATAVVARWEGQFNPITPGAVPVELQPQ